MCALVTIVLLGLPAQPVSAARPPRLPDLQCGVPVTTSVTLRADLTCATPVRIPWHTEPVTINLGGHTLRVDPAPVCDSRVSSGYPACTIIDESVAATITNGTVDGGITSRYGYVATRTTVSRVHVTGSIDTGLYGELLLSHDVIDAGIRDYHRAWVHDSVISGGIAIGGGDAGTPLDIIGNRIAGGISINDHFDFDLVGGVIRGNTISGSTGSGISIFGFGTNSMGRLDIIDNTITDNAGDGITYAQDSRYPSRFGDNGPITLKGNVTRRNGGHGIDLFETLHGGPAAGVVDGGGNRARGNALDPQCIGVPCGAVDHRLLPDVVWHNPAAITTETPLGPDQLNATASVPGTFTYSPAAGSLFAVGPWTISVHFVPDDLVTYQPTDRVVQLLVGSSPA